MEAVVSVDSTRKDRMICHLLARDTVDVVVAAEDVAVAINHWAWHSSHGGSEKSQQDQEDEMKKIHPCRLE